MSKKLLTLAFSLTLALFASAWLSGAAQAGPPSTCGDGNIEGDEECDDSNTVSGDGCSFPSCLPEVCGDNITNPDPAPGPAEECDDGNTTAGDGCDATCQLECGNGTIEGAEECDDSGESATCDDDCTAVACGDSNINEAAGEQCDDGNTVSDDGCSATCQSEIVEPQTKGQQGCINAINKNLAGVAKGQGSDNAKCLKDAAKGGPTTCFVAGTKTGKATAKTTKTATGKKCTGDNVPTVAFTSDTTVNGAGSDEVLGGTTVILGATPSIAQKSADKQGAKCQAEAIKQYNTIIAKWLAEANKAKKSTLKGGKGGTPPPAGSAADVATGIDTAITGNEKVGKAVTKAGDKLAKSCEGVTVDPLFDCGGAADVAALTTCVQTEAQRAACEALEVADGLALTCL